MPTTTDGSLRFAPRFVCLLAALALAPGGAQMRLSAATPAARAAFDPVTFFTGPTEGRGTLKKILSSPQATHVTGFGAVRPDGVLVIDQTVRAEGEKTTSRHWEIHEIQPGIYSGTISDAKGVVTAKVAGDQMQLRYTTRNGFSVAQLLTATADGRTLHNAMKIRKFGIAVATVDETIQKL